MVIDKIVHLDEEKQNQIEKTKMVLCTLGLADLYKENLDLVAYELGFHGYFSKINKHITSGGICYIEKYHNAIVVSMIRLNKRAYETKIRFILNADNRILIEGPMRYNTDDGHDDMINTITLSPLSTGDRTGQLYYDSEITSLVYPDKSMHTRISNKTVRHLVRQNGKCIMTTVPEYEELGKAYTKK